MGKQTNKPDPRAREAAFVEAASEIAAVVDDNGRLRANYAGLGAKADAELTLHQMKRGRVKCFMGGKVVTGADAQKAVQNGRI